MTIRYNYFTLFITLCLYITNTNASVSTSLDFITQLHQQNENYYNTIISLTTQLENIHPIDNQILQDPQDIKNLKDLNEYFDQYIEQELQLIKQTYSSISSTDSLPENKKTFLITPPEQLAEKTKAHLKNTLEQEISAINIIETKKRKKIRLFFDNDISECALLSSAGLLLLKQQNLNNPNEASNPFNNIAKEQQILIPYHSNFHEFIKIQNKNHALSIKHNLMEDLRLFTCSHLSDYTQKRCPYCYKSLRFYKINAACMRIGQDWQIEEQYSDNNIISTTINKYLRGTLFPDQISVKKEEQEEYYKKELDQRLANEADDQELEIEQQRLQIEIQRLQKIQKLQELKLELVRKQVRAQQRLLAIQYMQEGIQDNLDDQDEL